MADTKTYVMNQASTFHEGVEYHHGDEIELDPKRGKELAELGHVVPKSEWSKHQADLDKADAADEKAQADALKGAEEIEASKVAHAEATSSAGNEPAPVRRGPGRPPKA